MSQSSLTRPCDHSHPRLPGVFSSALTSFPMIPQMDTPRPDPRALATGYLQTSSRSLSVSPSAHGASEEAPTQRGGAGGLSSDITESSMLKSRNRSTQSRGWTKGNGSGPHRVSSSPVPSLAAEIDRDHLQIGVWGRCRGGKPESAPSTPPHQRPTSWPH